MIRGPRLCGEKRINPSKRAKKAYRLAKTDKKSAPARQVCRAGAFHRSAPFLYRFRRSAAKPNFSAKRQPLPPPLRRIAAQTGAQRNQRERLFLSEIEKVAASISLAATWRRGRDSNPRVVSHKLISSQPRYDRFDTSPYRPPPGGINADAVFQAPPAVASPARRIGDQAVFSVQTRRTGHLTKLDLFYHAFPHLSRQARQKSAVFLSRRMRSRRFTLIRLCHLPTPAQAFPRLHRSLCPPPPLL